MPLITILFIACGLAMDAFAVSVTSGITIRHLKIRHALRIALFFGAFQAIMPIMGWLAGIGLRDYVAAVDHWIAFGLLSVIGAKMIYESRKFEPIERETDPLNMYVLVFLSLATSIDALAVGLTLSLLVESIAFAVIIIGVVTFVLSFLGVYIGNTFGHFFEKKLEVIGGLILIAIGAKILVDHLV